MNGRIARPDSLAMIIHLVTGGSDTTSFQICSLLFRVLSQPGLRDRMRADPGLWEAAIEEDLRLDGAPIALFRTPNEDTEVNGVLVPKDTKVRVMYASANRDAEAFGRPDEFWLDRPTKELRKHVGSVTARTAASTSTSPAGRGRRADPRSHRDLTDDMRVDLASSITEYPMQGLGVHRLRWQLLLQSSSRMVALARPPPSHMVCSPYRIPLLRM